MGDRVQIAIKDGPEDRAVYLYSHSSGADAYVALQQALARRQRWEDSEYLARIIFQQLVGPEITEYGYGIGTARHGDIEHALPVLDCSKQRITWDLSDAQEDERNFIDCSFEDYAKHGPVRVL